MARVRQRNRPVRRSTKLSVLLLCAIAAAAACESPAPTQSPPSAAAIATVEIKPGAALLTEVGETTTLVAVALTADGTIVQAPITWASSAPSVVTVDSGGSVTAAIPVGTATITATAAGVTSVPAYVTVARPVAGAVLVTDEQIVSGPAIVDPAAEPAPDAPYEVVLRGAGDAAPGTIVINTGGLAVAGRVVSATPEGSDTRVRLVVVPPGELFEEVSFSDTVDLGEGPFEIPAELAAAYDVAQTGSAFTFSPKGGTSGIDRSERSRSVASAVLARWAAPAAKPTARRAGVAQGTRALPPLPPFSECEAEAGFGSGLPVPLSVSVPPTFSFNAAGSVTREATAAGTKIVVQATPTFTFLTSLEVKSAFEAKVSCKLTLVTRTYRVPGWAGLFFGGEVHFGVGFEVGGKVTLVSAKVGGTAELRPTFTGSLTCPTGGSCEMDGDSSATTKLEPVLEAPSLNQSKLEPSVNLFAFLDLEAGNADIDQLQFDAIEAKAGLELAASLALEGLQIDDTGPEGRSKYGLAFKGEIGPGLKLGEFFEYMGIASLVPLKLSFELALGDSPTGTVTADQARYLPGDSATVSVTLAQESTLFPSSVGLYNVRRVVLARRTGLTSETLATVDAQPGQTTFQLTFTSPGLIGASELHAFVVTTLLPLDPPKLEIGAPKLTCAGDPAMLTSIDDDPDKIWIEYDGASVCTVFVEVGEDDAGANDPNVIMSIDTDVDEPGWDGDPRGSNWQIVSGLGSDLPSGTRTIRARHVPSGTVFLVTVTVTVALIGGGDTTMKVQDISIVPAD